MSVDEIRLALRRPDIATQLLPGFKGKYMVNVEECYGKQSVVIRVQNRWHVKAADSLQIGDEIIPIILKGER